MDEIELRVEFVFFMKTCYDTDNANKRILMCFNLQSFNVISY